MPVESDLEQMRLSPERADRVLAAVLFDWDGTLSDSRAVLLAAWHASTIAVLGRCYPSSPEEEDVVFTLPGAQIWPAIAGDAEQANRLAAAFQTEYDERSPAIRAFPGIVAMLERVRGAGIATAVVTSKGRRRYEPDAARLGVGSAIDVAVCAGEAPASKPDPAPLDVALARLGIVGHQAAMVGDTVVDMAAGRTAGTTTIGVTWGHGNAAQLLAAGANAVVGSPAELAEILTAPNQDRAPDE
jgi:HAD superfamily hydrolase (TIGR01509 family)